MITRINQFEAAPGAEQALFAFLQSVIATIERCPGCRSCRLLRSIDNPARLAILEEWDSIDDHQRAAKAIPPERLAEAMPLFARPPVGIYYEG